MLVRDIMTTNVELVDPNIKLSEAAKKMRDLDVGFLPVGENDRLVGTVTDRDIAVRGIAEGKDPKSENIRDIMTPDVHYCYANQDIDEAARIMEDNQVRRLVVLNDDKRLVGIYSVGDIATRTDNPDLSSEVLEEVSKPKRAKE